MAKYDVGSSETLRTRLALPRHGPPDHQSIEGFPFFDKLAEVADIGVMSDIPIRKSQRHITHLEILPRFISLKFDKFANPHSTAGEICYEDQSSDMANSRFTYVRDFELADKVLPNTWMLVRIDGKGFHKQVSNGLQV